MANNIDILIKTLYDRTGIKASVKDINKLRYDVNSAGQVVDAFNKQFVDSRKVMEDLGKTASYNARRFKAEWLSVLFLSFSLNRSLTRLGTSVLNEFKRATESTIYWSSAVGQLSLGVSILKIALGETINQAIQPYVESFIDALPVLLDFISEHGTLVAGLGIFATAATGILSVIASWTLGLAGLSKILSSLWASLTAIGGAIGVGGAGGLIAAGSILVGIFVGLGAIIKQIIDYGFFGFLQNVWDGIKNVITVTTEWIKWWRDDLLNTAIGKVIVGIGEVIQKVKDFISLKTLWEGFTQFISWSVNNIWIPALRGVVSLLERIISLINRASTRIPGVTSGGEAGSRQFGGVIPATGLYRMHAGEMVYNPSFTGGNVTVNTGPVSSGVDVNLLASKVSEVIMKDVKRYVTPVSQYG